jgi:HD-GYP domain-containing protein (c-di-GMP phosphodiesterase class II)
VSQSITLETSRKCYVPIPVDVLAPDRVIPFDLYSRASTGAIKQVCAAGETIPAQTLRAWEQVGVTVLYVNTADHRLYQKFAEKVLSDLAARPDLPAPQKARIYYQTMRELVHEACTSNHIEDLAAGPRETFANGMVSLICEDGEALGGLLRMLSHDYYTYTHMVNVSVMAAGLAYRLGLQDRGRLRDIASGGLLHDIGKTRIQSEVLNKVGRLTHNEWEEIKTHPGLGLEYLHQRPDIRPTELLIVHQHHEKLDGSGYPLGLVGSEVCLEAQMTAVVDVYDALTCKRPYRPALSHETAIKMLREQAGDKLNADLVSAWQDTIERARKQGG